MNWWTNFGSLSQWKSHMCSFLKMCFSAWTCNAAEFSGRSNVNKCTFHVPTVAPEQGSCAEPHVCSGCCMPHLPMRAGGLGQEYQCGGLASTRTCSMVCLTICVNFASLGSKMRVNSNDLPWNVSHAAEWGPICEVSNYGTCYKTHNSNWKEDLEGQASDTKDRTHSLCNTGWPSRDAAEEKRRKNLHHHWL